VGRGGRDRLACAEKFGLGVEEPQWLTILKS
jgi:hypothetical protein